MSPTGQIRPLGAVSPRPAAEFRARAFSESRPVPTAGRPGRSLVDARLRLEHWRRTRLITAIVADLNSDRCAERETGRCFLRSVDEFVLLEPVQLVKDQERRLQGAVGRVTLKAIRPGRQTFIHRDHRGFENDRQVAQSVGQDLATRGSRSRA